ncbi:MAG: hypothetical protein PHU44_13665, partial [Syntrophales bacterium]|nr:hypothetical protein [Syntrophales bacterium]
KDVSFGEFMDVTDIAQDEINFWKKGFVSRRGMGINIVGKNYFYASLMDAPIKTAASREKGYRC